ncbi:MAG: hypothetical protein OXI87_04735 [Albidovulum sp.]|nr:hypothetical protein [Albidovulum sp.]
MRTAKIGWVTTLLLGCAAVTLSGCLTKTRYVAGTTTTVETKTPNIAQELLAVSDYGTDTSKILGAIEADAKFYFDESEEAGGTTAGGETVESVAFASPSYSASQSSNDARVNVHFGANDVNSLRFLTLDTSTDADGAATADDLTDDEITYSEKIQNSITLSMLTSAHDVFEDDKDSDEFGRKGTRYNVIHTRENGNAIVLFATESKYLMDYSSDDEDAEMFSGGYWVELSTDSDGDKVVQAAGVYSDAGNLNREQGAVWAIAAGVGSNDEVTATYSGMTDGGYSDDDGKAGAFSGAITLVAELFPSGVTANAGTVSGTVENIKLWAFQNFGDPSEDLDDVAITLGDAPVSLMGTFNGNTMVGTNDVGNWGGIFSNTTVSVGNMPEYVVGTYGFEHSDKAFLGHFGLANPTSE